MTRYSIAYILGSAISLLIGSILLIGRVPIVLTIGSIIVVIILSLSAALILKGYKSPRVVVLVIMLLLIISSTASPAHLSSLALFGSSIYITVLDTLMILGFYVFPILYIIDFLYSSLRKVKKLS